ncbi:MAG TPA: hypothetical protein VK623_04295 [Flavobacterium sp.]|nr:hypothetical protein [Flavobacterium sp.]
MKKLIIAAMLITGMASFAQEKPTQDRAKMEQLTPEQRNELHLKKLTLDLDLNASQQKEMGKILAEQNAKMETAKAERLAKKDAAVKPTKEERFAKQSQMLDDQIAMKARVKKILSAEQYDKWEKMKNDRHHEMKGHMGKRKGPKTEDK